jgi:AcrR family transcriptional regulator
MSTIASGGSPDKEDVPLRADTILGPACAALQIRQQLGLLRVERRWVEQLEARPPDARDRSVALERPEDPTRHLAARSDERRELGAREDRRIGEEQLAMSGQDAQDPAASVLVEKSVDTLGEESHERCQAVDDVKRKTGVGGGQLPDCRASPGDHDAVGQGREIRRRERTGEADQPVQLAWEDDHRNQLLAVDGRPTEGRETLEKQGDRDRLALLPDPFAGTHAPDTCRRGQTPKRFGSRARKARREQDLQAHGLGWGQGVRQPGCRHGSDDVLQETVLSRVIQTSLHRPTAVRWRSSLKVEVDRSMGSQPAAALVDDPARLGAEVLGDSNHVCGLFEDLVDTRAHVIPVVVAGLRTGGRIVYLTGDPAAVRAAIEAAVQDLDVAAEERTGRLEIRPWTASYLAGQRFSAARMLGVVRSILREGVARGDAGTRLIGEMDWAQDDLTGVDELLVYESGIDAILGHPPNLAICAYDVGRHSASRIAGVVAAHEAVFVGGRLQRTSRVARGTKPRDRILTAATQLFGDAGVRATGVDALIAAAGVAKATFYRQFPAKDDLIVAWLEDPRTRWFDRVRGRAEALADSPIDVVPGFFDALADWIEAGDYRGCPYLNTAVELRDSAHPAVATVQAYLREIERFLGELAAAAGARDPERIGTELQALAAGAITLGVAHRSSAFAIAAGRAAQAIVREAGGRDGQTEARRDPRTNSG